MKRLDGRVTRLERTVKPAPCSDCGDDTDVVLRWPEYIVGPDGKHIDPPDEAPEHCPTCGRSLVIRVPWPQSVAGKETQ